MKDLYHYVNGPWIAGHTIPADRGIDGTFHALRDAAEADVRELVEEDSGLAGSLYAAFMDVDSLNAAGIEPLAQDIDRVLDAGNAQELTRTIGQLEREGAAAPVAFWVEKDSGGEDAVAYLVQSGLGLPDEAYYREPVHQKTLEAYREHVARMLTFLPAAALTQALGSEEGEEAPAQAAAAQVVELETEIARGHWDVVTSRDAIKTYNPTEFAELPHPVQELLRGGQLPEERLVVMMPSYISHLAELLTDSRLSQWKLWALWGLLRTRAGVLSEEISAANFDFYGRVLSGAEEQRDRWKRGVSLAESLVGEEIGKRYVERHFPASSKEQMLELVDYLVRAYRERIDALDWMTQDTRAKALDKLELFKAKIGYPEHWRDYSGLEFSSSGARLVDNVRRGHAFNHDYELAKIGKPADRDEWVTTPQTVNAFYNPVVNDITFPAAILRPPFFDPEADAAENFGAIGAVIGHEIGHGFDDQGSRYDGHGNLNSWWSDEDREAFKQLTAKLVGQFDGLVPTELKEAGIDSEGVKGEFTLGENIGDLGGLGIAVVAYRQYLAAHGVSADQTEAKAFDIDGADPEIAQRTFDGFQRMFLSWARVWRTAIRPEMATQYLAIDPHSPAEFRCNVIAANVDEFYQAFPEVDEGSPMYIAPEDRVTIW